MPDYAEHLNPETLNTDPVYIFDVEMIPCPPGTPAPPRLANRPRVIPDPYAPPTEPVLYVFDDRTELPPSS